MDHDDEIGKNFINARRRFRGNFYGINPDKPTKVKHDFIKINKNDKTKTKVLKGITNILISILNQHKVLKFIDKNIGKLLIGGIAAGFLIAKIKDFKQEKYFREYEEKTKISGRFDESADPKNKIKNKIIDEANKQGVSPALALGVAETESHFNQNAKSGAGAIGVFQLMPATAAGLGVNPNNLDENIKGGITLLKGLLKKYGGDERKALAAYNWGSGNLAKYGIEKAPKETVGHYQKIMAAKSRYEQELSKPIIKPYNGKYSSLDGKTFGGYRVTSEFGYRIHPITKERTFHEGIDIDMSYKDVYAYVGGTVIFAGKMGGYGNCIKIKEDRKDLNVEHVYAHLSEIHVNRNEKVKTGQKIGVSGSTGRSTGPHLHYGIYVNGKPVDPRRYDYSSALAYTAINKNVAQLIDQSKVAILPDTVKDKTNDQSINENNNVIASNNMDSNIAAINIPENNYIQAYQKGWRSTTWLS